MGRWLLVLVVAVAAAQLCYVPHLPPVERAIVAAMGAQCGSSAQCLIASDRQCHVTRLTGDLRLAGSGSGISSIDLPWLQSWDGTIELRNVPALSGIK